MKSINKYRTHVKNKLDLFLNQIQEIFSSFSFFIVLPLTRAVGDNSRCYRAAKYNLLVSRVSTAFASDGKSECEDNWKWRRVGGGGEQGC